jgi:hypothetical protein
VQGKEPRVKTQVTRPIAGVISFKKHLCYIKAVFGKFFQM